jgi:hypothetical protein
MSVRAGEDAGGRRALPSVLALSSRFHRGGAACAREATRGLDETRKISKDMRMTAMPRIGARWSLLTRGCGD